MTRRGAGNGDEGNGAPLPPRGSEALLRWALRHTGLDPSPLGDLREEYRDIAARQGRRAADRWHRVEATRLALRLSWERRGARKGGEGGRPEGGGPLRTRNGGGVSGAASDLIYALRRLRKAPGFTAVTVLQRGKRMTREGRPPSFALIDPRRAGHTSGLLVL